ncbi:Krueppel-like factor 4 [Sciurus carolinensis]|uniref:Krueppel-like factor 4 n=1 Tax=Sciurus carolinensis TaxID=30640 RepID=A0AA41T5S3_SCICA|nr:Krueppel-like factor 4 [Sciurus carolinensis]
MGHFVLKASLSAPGSESGSPSGIGVAKAALTAATRWWWRLQRRAASHVPQDQAGGGFLGFHPHPGPNYPAFLPDQMQPQIHHQELMPPSSCLREEPKSKRGRRSWPRRRTATHACDYAAAAKPIPRVVTQGTPRTHTGEKPYHCDGTAAGGNLRALKN